MELEQLFQRFKEKAESLSAEVQRFSSGREAVSFIKNFIIDLSKKHGEEVKTVWADTPTVNNLLEKLEDVPNVYFGDDIPAQAEASLIGVSQLDAAIAESGTLVQDATQVTQRLVSTLSLIHIAIVPTSKLVATIAETITGYQENPPGYIAYISGPSRTADIERVLTIGVHGPERLIIVFVDEEEVNSNG